MDQFNEALGKNVFVTTKGNYQVNVNFREIPQGNIPDGNQDIFELFARDLFEALGFEIVSSPGRGSDDRKDLIISEEISGKLSSEKIHYLVSCKHNAHSANKKSVGNSEEPDILGRLKEHDCKGFIGFYSTIPSSSLVRLTEGLKNKKGNDFSSCTFFDSQKISLCLKENEKTLQVFKQYFPESFSVFLQEETKSGIYRDEPEISCTSCDYNILKDMNGFAINIKQEESKFNIYSSHNPMKNIYILKDILFCCNNCKEIVENKIQDIYPENHDIYWVEIIKYTDPKYYLRSIMNDIKFFTVYNDCPEINAFRKWNNFTSAMFYYVARKYKLKEQSEIQILLNNNSEAYKL